MSHKLLGRTFDIHGGGLDLVFPHHENEIAQSECCHGRPMVKYWMHNGLLRADPSGGKIGSHADCFIQQLYTLCGIGNFRFRCVERLNPLGAANGVGDDATQGNIF